MELDAVRDTTRDQSDSEWLQDALFHVTFERYRDPSGIMGWVWGRKVDAFLCQQAGPVVTRILTETHAQYGIPGAVMDYGNGRWLFRWDDQS